jgi:mRNA interferase RelE/StbE
MAYADLSNYAVVFSKSADKSLSALDKQMQQRILEKLKELKTNSVNLDIKKLKSHAALYRLRVGHFRVVYTIQHEQIIVYIVAVGHRRDVYQRLKCA